MEDFKMRFTGYALLLIPALIFISCGNRDSHPAGSGLVEATEVVLSAETSGQLKLLYFDEGQNIASGDTIGLIDTSTVILRLRQAEAVGDAAETKLEISSINIKQASYNLDLAKKEFDRIASLLKSGSANQQQYDRVETAYDLAVLSKEQADASFKSAQSDLSKARSEIAILQKQMNDCFPTSPLPGVIINKFVEPGELIGVGKPLVKIAKLDTVWVKIYLPPADLTKISLGGHAQVDPEDGRNKPLDGTVSWISDEAEFTPKNVQTKEARADLVYAVKITIPNPGKILKIGMPVSVKIQ
jgi:HlyD family secretion protein